MRTYSTIIDPHNASWSTLCRVADSPSAPRRALRGAGGGGRLLGATHNLEPAQ
jgi:hypothetical protein